MPTVIRTRKGLDIKLVGEADKTLQSLDVKNFALKPTDFIGVFPKLLVAPGDKVLAGSPLIFDKYREEVKFCSPVSGTVTEVKRGPKRILEEIRIEADGKQEYLDLGKADPANMERGDIIKKMLDSGTWPFIKQRPYSVIANPADIPLSIHISAFDSAPLAPDYDFILETKEAAFKAGIKVLKKLTDGKLHLNIHTDHNKIAFLQSIPDTEISTFSGPHPVGNVGIQIHHIKPINKGEIIWVVNPMDVASIGNLFLEGRFDSERIYALTGSEVNKQQYVRSYIGASALELVQGGLKEGLPRMISGNVLTGERINKDGYIGFYHHQFTAIPEGKYYEFMGWALPGLGKFSASKTFFAWLNPSKKYKLDTNTHGGERAFVMTGEYEKVLPMDIMPVALLKAILVEDIDKMENLGIYEIDEEDLALCEVICTSKIPVQEIVRNGLDSMRKEMS